MLEIPTFRQLRTQTAQDLKVEAAGSLNSAILTAIAYALAGILYAAFKALQYLSKQLFVDTADAAFALLWAHVYGIEPNPATPATGSVQATGTAGSSISAGTQLQREDGALFTADDNTVIPAVGQLTINVTAVVAGEDGNTETPADLTFVAPPAGIDATATVLAPGLDNGFEAETPAQTQARVLEFIRSPRRGGSEADYEFWAKEVTGITAAYARGSYAGIGTVLVIIAKEWDPTDAADDPIPTAAQIAAVEAYLEERKPAGLYLVAVQPPTLQDLDPYIVLDPDTPEIRDAVQRSLALALASVEPGGVAYYDDLVAAINRAAGEEHHQLWTSDGLGGFGPYNTTVGDNNLMVIGTPTWTAPP